MSIINDALKKVENSLNIPPAAPKAKINKYLIYALIFVFGIFLENTFFQYFFQPGAGFSETPLPTTQDSRIQLSSQQPMELKNELAAQPLPETIQVTALAPSPPPLPAVEEKETAPKETALILNGIFFSQDNSSYAMINNKIVKEGDDIEGAIVKRIGLNNVELESQGGELVKLSKDR